MTPEAMAALHARCFPDRPWSAEEIEALLNSAGVVSFVSPDGDGLLLTRVLPPEAEMLTLAVLPEARRRGVGSALVARWIADMERLHVTDLHLEVAVDNAAALAFYARHRFQPSGRRPRYYSRSAAGPVNTVLMTRAVPRCEDH